MPDEGRKYERVDAYLRHQMREQYAPHAKLPTERDLAEQLAVSRLTVRRALDQLSADGLVYRIQGAGTFVAEPPIRKDDALTSFSEDMRDRGLEPSARVLRTKETVAGAEASWRLGISPGEQLVRVVRLRLADGTPLCLEDAQIVRAFAPQLLEHDLTKSMYDVLATTYEVTITRAEQSVRATVVEEADARQLGVPALSPALLVERVTYEQNGHGVEWTRSVYRGDRYSFDRTLWR